MLMRPLARVLIDESHRQAWTTRAEVAARMSPANPADASYAEAAEELRRVGFDVDVHVTGPLDAASLRDVDVLVLPHCSSDEWEATTGEGSPLYADSEIAAIDEHVRAGGGLVVLAETEQAKYGNNLADITRGYGIDVVTCTAQDPVHRFNEVSTWVRLEPSAAQGADVFAGVSAACAYRAGVLAVSDDAYVFARTSDQAMPASAPVIAGVDVGAGRVLVVADSDFAGDDSIDDLDHRRLWRRLITWAAARRAGDTESQADSALVEHPAWTDLVAAVEALRPLQAVDGSVTGDPARAGKYVDRIITDIAALAPLVPHQADYLAACASDFRAWRDSGLAVPDFLDSLQQFRPDQNRRDGVEHLVVFPMYTQNGNPDRNVEAVVIRTVWPDWIAELEATSYDNAAFVPIEFVAFTSGYDTHSAVLFPETVATREVVKFTWGGIFCDREAARFRHVSRAAAERLQLGLPPEAELLLGGLASRRDHKSAHVRCFTGGDCYSAELRDAIFQVCRQTPELTHYYYTKNLPLLAPDLTRLIQLPDNLRVTASWGGRFDHLIKARLFPRSARVVHTRAEAAELGLAIDFNDRLAWQDPPSHFCHLSHGSQQSGSEAQVAIRQRRQQHDFTGYGAARVAA
jgi:hypothetical protein